mmetsp:Transcript_35421/g.52035  ORF Transcript_35421/g.52035 Transcript_35421/m.52035 type:complete len:286 (-) Transcript_35421:40-897(-)
MVMPKKMTIFLLFCATQCSLALAFGTPSSVVLWNSGSCPYAQRAWIALEEKKVQYAWSKVDLFDKEATPEFGAAYKTANPNPLCSSKVPVLVVRDEASVEHSFTESRVVLDAIEELFPAALGHPALLPLDVADRARARVFGEAVFDGAFGGQRSAYSIAIRKLDADEGKGSWDEEAERAKLCESLSALETSLGGGTPYLSGPFVLGDHFSMAECMTAPFAQRAGVILAHYCDIDVLELCKEKSLSRAEAWWRAVTTRESVVKTGVPPEDVIKGSDRLIQMMRSRK